MIDSDWHGSSLSMSFSFESTGKAKVSFGNPTGHEFAKAQIPVAALGTEPFGTWIQRVSRFLLSRWTHVSSVTLTSVSRLPAFTCARQQFRALCRVQGQQKHARR